MLSLKLAILNCTIQWPFICLLSYATAPAVRFQDLSITPEKTLYPFSSPNCGASSLWQLPVCFLLWVPVAGPVQSCPCVRAPCTDVLQRFREVAGVCLLLRPAGSLGVRHVVIIAHLGVPCPVASMGHAAAGWLFFPLCSRVEPTLSLFTI